MRNGGELPKRVDGLKFFAPIRRFADALHARHEHPNRNLHLDDYLVLLLLAYFNPAISGLRQLIELPGDARLEGNLGLHHTSLGSFSEASAVFDPEPLRNIFRELSDQAHALNTVQRPQGLPDDLKVLAADATLWKLLPRMAQALYQRPRTRARKAELKGHFVFDVFDHVPVGVELTSGKTDERHVLPMQLETGALYVLDRGYISRPLWHQILDAGCSFVARIKSDFKYAVTSMRELSAEAREAGVLSDECVEIEAPDPEHPARKARGVMKLRVIRAKKICAPSRNLDPRHKRGKHAAQPKEETEHELVLLTDRFDLDAADVVALYTYRWQIEIFFRWFKCVMKCRHLFAETLNGLALQIYAALIASLLVVIYTGRKPTKQLLFLLQMYLGGGCGWERIEREIAKLKPTKA
jgi:IS4 transposase